MQKSLLQKWREYTWKIRFGGERRADFVEYCARYFFTFSLTPSGISMLLALLIPMPLAMLDLSFPAYQICVGVFVLLFFVFLAARFLRKTVRVTGGVPDKVSAATPFLAEYTIENQSKRAVYAVGARFFYYPVKKNRGGSKSRWRLLYSRYGMGLFLPNKLKVLSDDIVIDRIEPGEMIRFTLEVEYARRGVYDLPPFLVYSEFPFNLYRTPLRLSADSTIVQGASVTVLPTFTPAEAIEIPPAKNYQPGGIALTSNIGESPEYIGSREYRAGDNVRRIDFRGWARTGAPVVREFQEEYYSRIALVMDTFVPKGEALTERGYPNLEGAVQLSAAIADVLSNGEYIIDLFAAGPDLYVFRAGRHTAHFENVLEVLACLDRCTDNPFDEIAPALLNELHNISTAIFVFMNWDETREALVRTAMESGCSVKVYIVCEGATTLPIEHAEHLVGQVLSFTPDEVARGAYEVL